MAFDAEKIALSFYGVVDERFAVETDLFKLHIHRKRGLKNLQVERSIGRLDIYIPNEWDMEKYCNQEKMRKLMASEIKWQALNIYQQRTNLIANHIGLGEIRVSVGNKGNYNGCCNYMGKQVKYNMWTICGYQSQHVDLLISHELAHFYVHSHSQRFWRKLDEIYFSIYDDEGCKEDVMLKLNRERDLYHMYYYLKNWGKVLGLKRIYKNGLIIDKAPMIHPIYIRNKKGDIIVRWYLRNFVFLSL